MVINRQRAVRIRCDALEDFLARVRELCGLGREAVTVALISDREIAQLNRQFRGKRGPTDVLSFPSEPMGTARTGKRRARARAKDRFSLSPAAAYLGDIAIAPATARRNARRIGRRLDDELRVLILHGVLHLLGYDHESDSGEMHRIESRLRHRLGIGRP